MRLDELPVHSVPASSYLLFFVVLVAALYFTLSKKYMKNVGKYFFKVLYNARISVGVSVLHTPFTHLSSI